MRIDGFDPESASAFHGLSVPVARRFYAILNRLARRLDVEVDGLEHLPSGGALIVANHTFGFDIAFAMGAIFSGTGRVVWALGEHAWWKVPFLRRLAASVGVVDGTSANADALLGAGELVLVLPGGLRESMKPRELRYRLLWGRRYGFIRAAIRNQAPIVPLAAIGADDIFELVGNAFVRGKRLGFPLPRPWAGLPIPHRVELRYRLGAPVVLQAPPHAADDQETLRRARREVEGALHEILDQELARRSGFDLE